MECPRSATIKEELDMFYSDNRNDSLQIDLDVSVKIEHIPGGDDWCLENNDLLREIDKRFAEIDDYECNICKQNFSESHLLFQHNLDHLQVSLKETIFVCDLCSAGYLTKDDLVYHFDAKHIEMNKPKKDFYEPITKSHIQCSICKKVFKYKSWHDHMRTVHAERIEKCTQCGEILKCKRYLQRHIKYVHNILKPKWRKCPVTVHEVCACDECGKKFTDRIALKTHKKNCHSVRTYQCYICQSVLKCKSYLMAHIQRVHYFDGFKHTCSICSKNFKSPRYLKIHVKNSHSKTKECRPFVS